MATVRQVFTPEEAQFQNTAFPQFLRIAGTNFPVTGLAYADATTNEFATWKFLLQGYASGDITINLFWYAATATTGNVIWNAQLAAITPSSDTDNVETKSQGTLKTHSAVATSGSSKAVTKTSFPLTAGELNSAAAGDVCWLEIGRDGVAGGDTMVGDAILVLVEVTYSDV